MTRPFVRTIAIAFGINYGIFCAAQQSASSDDLKNRESKMLFQKLGIDDAVTVDQAIASLVQLAKMPNEVFKCVLLDDKLERRRLAMHIFCRKKSAESAQVCLSALADADPDINHLALLGIRLNYELLDDPTFAIVRLLASDKRRVQSVSIDSYDQVPIACDAANLLADVGFKNHAFVHDILEECVVGKHTFGNSLNPLEQTKIRLNCSIAMVNHSKSSSAEDFFLSSIKNRDSDIAEEAILCCYYLKLGADCDFFKRIHHALKSITAERYCDDSRQEFAIRVLEFFDKKN